MKQHGTVSTPRRRRSDREALIQVISTAATVPNATDEMRHAVEHLAIEPTHEDIARRAYQLFEDRGGERGDELKDWLQAERELRDEAVIGVFGRMLATGRPYVGS